MNKLPVSIQTFSELIGEGYLYVDKTREIFNLIDGAGKNFFLSRPRRFGKSLLVSTLKEIFSGNRELFKGLWIYDKLDWTAYPVIHIDFSGLRYGSKEELEETLDFLVESNAGKFGIQLRSNGYDKKCKELITRLSQKNKVVFLVDEYDKPIIDYVDRKTLAAVNQEILRSFYAILKGSDEHIKFAFFTGVSKFSRVSVFSGLNNLIDITMDPQFASLLGYTEGELRHYFSRRLADLSEATEVDQDRLWDDIKRWYDGYSWDGKTFVYNPLSILNLFSRNAFGNYWFETATPTFLMKLIKEYQSPLPVLEDYQTDDSIFESFDIQRVNPVSLFFQAGYLTVKKVERASLTRSMYYLSYPNLEVKESFLKHILAEYQNTYPDDAGRLVFRMGNLVRQGHIPAFLEEMKALFASIPYNIFPGDRESYYHSLIYLALTLVGIEISAEVQTNTGRIDAVVETDSQIFIMEFKLGSSEEALEQIKTTHYHQKYATSSKAVKLIGVGIDTTIRNISSYLIEDA